MVSLGFRQPSIVRFLVASPIFRVMPQDASVDPAVSDVSDELSSPSVSPLSSPELLTVKVAHGLRMHEITLPADATFGDLKLSLAQLTGVNADEQRLLLKGKQKEDSELLLEAGLKANSKLLLLENSQSREKRRQEVVQNERITKACLAVAQVREEVDKLSTEVSNLEAMIVSGNPVSENKFALLSELLMQQLLKLDGIEAEGEAKLQRKNEVQRVQKYADMVDRLKSEICNPNGKSMVVYSPASKPT